MNKKWIMVIIASIFEVGWASGLTYAHDFTTRLFTLISLVICFAVLLNAAQSLPASTVYAVSWV